MGGRNKKRNQLNNNNNFASFQRYPRTLHSCEPELFHTLSLCFDFPSALAMNSVSRAMKMSAHVWRWLPLAAFKRGVVILDTPIPVIVHRCSLNQITETSLQQETCQYRRKEMPQTQRLVDTSNQSHSVSVICLSLESSLTPRHRSENKIVDAETNQYPRRGHAYAFIYYFFSRTRIYIHVV